MAAQARLVKALGQLGADHLVVVTGAGISLASGIPTFRGTDEGAVWQNEVTEKGTFEFFRRDPAASWHWSMKLFDQVPDAAPNAAHRALVDLENWHRQRGGRFTLITQNVDSLHEAAGSEDLVKVHGTLDRVRCSRTHGCGNGSPRGSLPVSQVDFSTFRQEPNQANVPRCPTCGEVLRQHVLWFDEFYADHDDYQWPRVQAAAASMKLLLFVGTSFAVGVTELFLQASRSVGCPTFSINPESFPAWMGAENVTAKAEEALPAVVKEVLG